MDIETLIDRLKMASGNTTDVFYSLYTDFFEKGDKPEEVLRTLIEYPEEIGDAKDENPTKISQQRETRCYLEFAKMINATAYRIAEMNLSKEDYYKELYKVIFCSEDKLWPQDKEEKVIALRILSESVPAYYQVIETETVSKEEFDAGGNKITSKLQEALYMLEHRKFATTPEETAQVLRIADSIENGKEKIIFWTIILNNLRNSEEK